MDRGEELRSLVESLHEQIWELPGDELGATRELFLRRLAAAGVPLAAILDELADETLALAFQKHWFANETFTALMVDRYRGYLARWLFRWGTESHLALDLIQHLYVAFFERGLAAFRPEEHFRAYLRRSAYNLWIEKVCRARKYRPLGEADAVPSPRLDPEQTLLDREAVGRIAEALGQLLPHEQAVLREAMEDRSADEIAQALGLAKSKVFMTLFRGRRRLEKILSLPPRKQRPTNQPASRLPTHEQEPTHA